MSDPTTPTALRYWFFQELERSRNISIRPSDEWDESKEFPVSSKPWMKAEDHDRIVAQLHAALDAYEVVTADITDERDEARSALATAQHELIFYMDVAKHRQALNGAAASGPAASLNGLVAKWRKEAHEERERAHEAESENMLVTASGMQHEAEAKWNCADELEAALNEGAEQNDERRSPEGNTAGHCLDRSNESTAHCCSRLTDPRSHSALPVLDVRQADSPSDSDAHTTLSPAGAEQPFQHRGELVQFVKVVRAIESLDEAVELVRTKLKEGAEARVVAPPDLQRAIAELRDEMRSAVKLAAQFKVPVIDSEGVQGWSDQLDALLAAGRPPQPPKEAA